MMWLNSLVNYQSSKLSDTVSIFFCEIFNILFESECLMMFFWCKFASVIFIQLSIVPTNFS